MAHVVVLGGGFGGLTFCKDFKHPNARVTIVDRQNHHLFQPLLYQVATASLSPAQIAQPIRYILRDARNITVVMAEITEIRPDSREIITKAGSTSYDYLGVHGDFSPSG